MSLKSQAYFLEYMIGQGSEKNLALQFIHSENTLGAHSMPCRLLEVEHIAAGNPELWPIPVPLKLS